MVPVALHHVNEVVGCCITAQCDVGIVDPVLRKDGPDWVQIQRGLRNLEWEWRV